MYFAQLENNAEVHSNSHKKKQAQSSLPIGPLTSLPPGFHLHRATQDPRVIASMKPLDLTHQRLLELERLDPLLFNEFEIRPEVITKSKVEVTKHAYCFLLLFSVFFL